jgi:hypothetical protein
MPENTRVFRMFWCGAAGGQYEVKYLYKVKFARKYASVG